MYNDIHDQITRVAKYLHLHEVCIDSAIFKLHYVATVVIFVVYSLLVTISTYAGDPIDCHTREDVIKGYREWGDFLDWFCYIHGTRNLKWKLNGGGPLSCGVDDTDCSRPRHTYYMWVALFSLAMAGLSYIPHFLWHSWEGGRMRQMLANVMEAPKFFHDSKNVITRQMSTLSNLTLTHQVPLTHPVDLENSGNKLTAELAKNYIDSLGDNGWYVTKYCVSEVLCLLVCGMQVVFTDMFLNNNFLEYGYSVMEHLAEDPLERDDPMMQNLPIVTSCTFYSIGKGGFQETTQAICVLPNNIVHQKFFLFLWFWYLLLVTLTVSLLVYRVILYTVPGLRTFITMTFWAVTDQDDEMDKKIRLFLNKRKKSSYSDWIVLASFHSNLTTVNFQNFLQDLLYYYSESSK